MAFIAIEMNTKAISNRKDKANQVFLEDCTIMCGETEKSH